MWLVGGLVGGWALPPDLNSNLSGTAPLGALAFCADCALIRNGGNSFICRLNYGHSPDS